MTEASPRALVVRKELELDAPLRKVWRAITEPARIADWFSDEVRGPALQPGSVGEFAWHSHGGFAFEVEEVDPPHHLVWRWAREPGKSMDECVWTRVDWALAELPDDRTRLTLVETGFVDEAGRRENDGGWDHELGELAVYVRS